MLPDSLDARINEIKSEKDPLIQARLVAAIKDDMGISGVELARRLGYMPSHISHLLRVLKLPDMVIDGYMSKLVSFTHLIIISRLKTEDQIHQLYEEVLTRSFTISQTEQRVREIMYQIDSRGEYLSTDKLASYQQRMSSSLGAQVHIVQTRIKCKITIELSGNLERTTAFIDDLGNKFRSKRKKGNAVILHQKTLPHTPIAKGIYDPDSAQMVKMERFTLDAADW